MKKILYTGILILAVWAGPLAADENFTTISETHLGQLESMHVEAERLIALGQMREALEIYWQIILIEPDDDAAYTGMGELYLVLSDLPRAEDAFKNALHINPDNEDAAAGLYKISHPDSV